MGVTSIGSRAYDCSNLTSIIIPEGVTSIGDYAFNHCSSLVIFAEVSSKPEGWSSKWNDWNRPVIWGYLSPPSSIISSAANNTVRLEWSKPVGSYNNLIKGYHVYRNGEKYSELVTEMDFEDKFVLSDTIYSYYVKAVYEGKGESHPSEQIFAHPSNFLFTLINNNSGYSIAKGSSTLAEITIPKIYNLIPVIAIANAGFANHTTLTSIIIPTSITSIGMQGFMDCIELPTILLPLNIDTIGANAFWGCDNLTIYAVAPSKPTGWHNAWNPHDRPVHWGSTISEIDEVIDVFTTNLHGNYPNPFNPETMISFSVKAESKVKIDIFNIKGQKVKSLINEVYPMGNHKVLWNGKDNNDRAVSSGVYFTRMTTGKFQTTKKMLLMK